MTIDQWSAVVGFFLPALVSIVNREEWKSWIKAVVALGASVIGGTVTAALAGQFTGSHWLQSMGIVFAASQVFYHTWWKNSNISGWIERTFNVISGKAPVDAGLDPDLGGTPGKSGDARSTE